ncbi:MAG: FAD:protein FMN transferase, partial [Propionibacteriaceae bacterium]|nr:FAD:protein FMN transferase [Propionibacteriaceae bacterium]
MGSARWNTLDTWCEMLTVREADLPEVTALARARLAELTNACLGADSELAGLAPGRPQRISEVLALALEAALRTFGFTDDRVGTGWREIDLDRAAGQVTVPEGLRLEVAARVRSWASDWVARGCADALGVGCLVNLGGDIAVRGEVPDGGWQVEIDDGRPDSRGYPVISMGWPGGLATRSATSGAWHSVTV